MRLPIYCFLAVCSERKLGRWLILGLLWNLIGEIDVFHTIYMGDSIEDQDLHGEISVLHAIYMGDSIEDQEMGVITT